MVMVVLPGSRPLEGLNHVSLKPPTLGRLLPLDALMDRHIYGIGIKLFWKNISLGSRK